MGLRQREADGAVEASVRGCSGAETQDRGYAAAGEGTTETQRDTRRA